MKSNGLILIKRLRNDLQKPLWWLSKVTLTIYTMTTNGITTFWKNSTLLISIISLKGNTIISTLQYVRCTFIAEWRSSITCLAFVFLQISIYKKIKGTVFFANPSLEMVYSFYIEWIRKQKTIVPPGRRKSSNYGPFSLAYSNQIEHKLMSFSTKQTTL